MVFAINFSGQSLTDTEFADELIARIEASGLPPQSLCFELTESATIANLARAEVLMRRLRKLGCGVALDDFGTGLSSLAYLRQLPVSMLKIDGSFVRDILRDPDVPRRAKIAPALTIVYLAIPIDLIPDFIPFADELLLASLTLLFARRKPGL